MKSTVVVVSRVFVNGCDEIDGGGEVVGGEDGGGRQWREVGSRRCFRNFVRWSCRLPSPSSRVPGFRESFDASHLPAGTVSFLVVVRTDAIR
ncbi:hypothetical protein Hdeb2414_s0213g00835291 [Helianthus debilis subsp. tardiflorus]